MPDTYILALSLLLVGFCILAVLFGREHYRKQFVNDDVEEVEAVVTDLKPFTSRPYNFMVCPIVEFSYESRLITAHHYFQVPEEIIDFRKGDTITVEINPKKPKIFRLRSAKLYALEDRLQKSNMIVVALGACTFLAGVVMMIVTLVAKH